MLLVKKYLNNNKTYKVESKSFPFSFAHAHSPGMPYLSSPHLTSARANMLSEHIHMHMRMVCVHIILFCLCFIKKYTHKMDMSQKVTKKHRYINFSYF